MRLFFPPLPSLLLTACWPVKVSLRTVSVAASSQQACQPKLLNWGPAAYPNLALLYQAVQNPFLHAVIPPHFNLIKILRLGQIQLVFKLRSCPPELFSIGQSFPSFLGPAAYPAGPPAT